MFELFEYQRSAAEGAVESLSAPPVYGEEPLLVLPTGAGKTEVAIEVAVRLSNEGRKVCFLADRKSELRNFCERAGERGCVVDAEMVQTMVDGKKFYDYDIFIMDEAHELYKDLLCRARVSGKRYMGMTATPFRRGLQNHYGPIISGPTTNDMIAEGRLIRPTGVIHNWSGEYLIVADLLSSRIVGPTLAFVPGDDIRACQYAFHDANVPSFAIHSGMEQGMVENIVESFEAGRTHLLILIRMLSRGYDHPPINNLLDFARQGPSSFGLHVQKVGRLMRSWPTKEMAWFHDYVGNWERFRDARELFWEEGVRDWADVARFRSI